MLTSTSTPTSLAVDRFFKSARLYIEAEDAVNSINQSPVLSKQAQHGIIHNHVEGMRLDGESVQEGSEESIKDEVLAALVTLNMVAKELAAVPDFAEQARPDHDAKSQHDFLDAYVGYVEVCWDGRIQQVSFPIPLYANYFKQASRDTFLKTVDLDGPEKRMKQLAKEVIKSLCREKSGEGYGGGRVTLLCLGTPRLPHPCLPSTVAS